jgi:hypothetical protein
MRRGTVQGTQANLTLRIGGIGIGTGSCSWRQAGSNLYEVRDPRSRSHGHVD